MRNRTIQPSGPIWSFFSGGMGLDLGLEMAGLKTSIAVEIDPLCCETIRLNRPEIVVLEKDVREITAEKLREVADCRDDVYLLVGGPPCQSFSPGGKRASLSDPRGNLIYEYLRLIKEIGPRYFLLENVANLITAALEHRPIEKRPGKNWNLSAYSDGDGAGNPQEEAMKPTELSGSAFRQILRDVASLGYHINFKVVDACDYGNAQHRLRFIMVGSRNEPSLAFPVPTHGPNAGRPWVTLREAIGDLAEHPGPHSAYTPDVAAVFELVPPGSNWRSLPRDLQKKALGPAYEAGGGKSGFFRRLHWDSPSPTITGTPNRKGGAMCHPDQTRPLSVHECARLQGFPDDWRFAGSMSRQYGQIGNAVPVFLARALAGMFVNPVPAAQLPQVAVMLDSAVMRLRHSARNKRGISKEQKLLEFA